MRGESNMESEIFGTIGSGAGGGMVGALIAWWGLKGRIDSLEKIISTMVSHGEFIATISGLSQRINNSMDRFNRIDANIELIRQLLLTARKRTDLLDRQES